MTRVSAETLGLHRSSVPFAFLYEYRPVEHQARLASVSAEIDDDVHSTVIDCGSENIWPFHASLSDDCLMVELGSARLGALDPWLAIACATSHGSANPLARA